jgi:hypothetical protein
MWVTLEPAVDDTELQSDNHHLRQIYSNLQ